MRYALPVILVAAVPLTNVRFLRMCVSLFLLKVVFLTNVVLGVCCFPPLSPFSLFLSMFRPSSHVGDGGGGDRP